MGIDFIPVAEAPLQRLPSSSEAFQLMPSDAEEVQLMLGEPNSEVEDFIELVLLDWQDKV